jgi:hypothetical protein
MNVNCHARSWAIAACAGIIIGAVSRAHAQPAGQAEQTLFSLTVDGTQSTPFSDATSRHTLTVQPDGSGVTASDEVAPDGSRAALFNGGWLEIANTTPTEAEDFVFAPRRVTTLRFWFKSPRGDTRMHAAGFGDLTTNLDVDFGDHDIPVGLTTATSAWTYFNSFGEKAVVDAQPEHGYSFYLDDRWHEYVLEREDQTIRVTIDGQVLGSTQLSEAIGATGPDAHNFIGRESLRTTRYWSAASAALLPWLGYIAGVRLTVREAVHPAFLMKLQNPAQYDAAETLAALDSAETICGTNDLQFVNAYDGTLGPTVDFVQAHKVPVGAIARASDKTKKYCSGTLVGTNVFLTAGHCVGTKTVGELVSFRYELEGAAGSDALPEAFFRIAAVIDAPSTKDIALLRLDGDPGALFGWALLYKDLLPVSSAITIIQHPLGDPKMVEGGTVSSTDKGYWYSDLDTQPGSSGSGILEASGRVAGVHTDGYCSPAGGSNYGVTMPDALQASAALGDVAHGTSWSAHTGWCAHAGAELHVGDFNGDGRDDLLCHDTNTGHKWIALANGSGQFVGSSWEAAMSFCNHTGAKLHIGDFNGDAKHDMLCHDLNTGAMWVALADPSGHFSGTSWEAGPGFCNHDGAELYIGDFNADGRDDMLCHDRNSGEKWVALTSLQGQFQGTTWSAPLGFCNHDGAELHIGDFNGDHRDDMLCHDRNDGHKWIALASPTGTFSGSTWDAPMAFCNHAGAQLLIGDFNGDLISDLLCHDQKNGDKWLAFGTPRGEIASPSWSGAMGWCNHPGAALYVGSFNTDMRADMLCHDSAGDEWIANSRPDIGFF